jgi:signal transduction histidine kinase
MADAVVGRRGLPPPNETLGLRTLVHDLRQPALAMAVLVSILTDRDDVPEDVRSALHQLNQQIMWMRELLAESQDAGAPSVREPPRDVRGGTGTYPGRADASAVARAVVGSSNAYVGVVTLDAPASAPVLGEATALRRALTNLVDNAMRAAGRRGRVLVTVRPDGGHVHVDVEDDGPGFGRVQLGNRLGLTVVAQAALAAEGTIEIGVGALGGVRVTMHLRAVGSDTRAAAG